MARSTKTDKSRARRKFERVMREHAAGKLRSSSGHKVTSRQQAVAIAASEARQIDSDFNP